MNKEEIPVFSWNTKTKKFYILGHTFTGVNSIEDFIDYITKLDKENKQLKEELQQLNKSDSSKEQSSIDYYNEMKFYKDILEELKKWCNELGMWTVTDKIKELEGNK